jgi:hypothetical protein
VSADCYSLFLRAPSFRNLRKCVDCRKKCSFFRPPGSRIVLVSGGVSQRPVNQVVARSMKRQCMYCGPCNDRDESSSRSKGGLCKGGIAEALTSWQSKKLASLQAGNRAEKMTRSVQWRDRELERSVWSPWYSRQLARLLVAFFARDIALMPCLFGDLDFVFDKVGRGGSPPCQILTLSFWAEQNDTLSYRKSSSIPS